MAHQVGRFHILRRLGFRGDPLPEGRRISDENITDYLSNGQITIEFDEATQSEKTFIVDYEKDLSNGPREFFEFLQEALYHEFGLKFKLKEPKGVRP